MPSLITTLSFMAAGIVTTQVVYRVLFPLAGVLMTLLYLVLGTIFGFILSRSGAADYDFIQGMFLFTNLQLYGIIGVAVLVAAPGIWLIKQRGRTLVGRARSRSS